MSEGHTRSAPNSDRYTETRLTLYQCSVSEIAGFKGQQWAIFTTAWAGYAAAVSLREKAGWTCGEQPPVLVVLLVLAVLAAWAATMVGLWNLETSINVRRERLARVRLALQYHFDGVYEVPKPKDRFLPIFFFLLTLGAALAVVFLLAMPPPKCTC